VCIQRHTQGLICADDEVLKALDFIGAHFKRINIRVFDRGYDANVCYERLIDRSEAFMIREKKNRDMIYKGEKMNILELAKRFKGKYGLKFRKKTEWQRIARVPWPVKLPRRLNKELSGLYFLTARIGLSIAHMLRKNFN